MTDKTFEQINEPVVLEENVSFEDFLLRYEGQGVEWHVGKVIQKMSNNEIHQALQVFLTIMLGYFLGIKKLGKIYQDGYQMQLNDDKPARQPDLLIVFNEHEDRIKHQYLDGAADVVIEIVSPATGTVDRGDKFYQYQDGGVPEYWIIDPVSKQIDIYHLDEEGNYQRIKEATDKIISRQLEGFELDASILWQDDLPDGAEAVELVQVMLK